MANSASMTIRLTPDLESFVRSRVDSGHYRSVSEVIQEGLRLLLARDDSVFGLAPAEARSQIQVGWEQAERGELVDGEDLFRELEARLGSGSDSP